FFRRRVAEILGADPQIQVVGTATNGQEAVEQTLALHPDVITMDYEMRWEKEERPQLSVLPFRNETSEHIDSALDALISDVETALINAGHVAVISLESQGMLIEQVRRQQGDDFDQGKSAALGRQLGVKYIITGKVF